MNTSKMEKNKLLKVVFFGTPEYAVPSLQAIISSRHQVVAVVTQPDKLVGRKKILTPSKVKEFAIEKGRPIGRPCFSG